jgi:hypothetical protein
MNKLDREARARILHLPCEGNSVRAITRLTSVSKTSVTKLLVDVGTAAPGQGGVSTPVETPP